MPSGSKISVTVAAFLIASGAGAQKPLIDDSGSLARVQVCERLAASPARPTPAETRRIVACANGITAEEMNRQLPVRVDEVTVLNRVAAEDTLFTYFSTIERAASQLSAEQRNAIAAGARAYVCAQSQMVATIRAGGAYRYVWSDPEGRPVTETRIASC